MAKLDDLIQQKQQRDEDWKAKKTAEREELRQLSDDAVMRVTSEPNAYLRYLDTQAINPQYSAANVMLAMAQNPDITYINSLENWGRLGRSVNREETGLKIRVSDPYVKDGRQYHGYKIGRVFDVTQTHGKAVPAPLTLRDNTPEMEAALSRLLDSAGVPVVTDAAMYQDAFYDPKAQRITVSTRLSDSKTFAALAREIVHAGIHDRGRYPYYSREDCAMDAECVSYMLCRNFSIDVPQPNVSRVGQAFDGMEAQDRRSVVDSLQKYFRIPVMDYRQYRRARKLVHECCNYIAGNCIALDDGEECICVQSISYSLLCRWFRAAVLPQDKELETALFHRLNAKKCAVCGALFTPGSNRAKYCPECAARMKRINAAKRKRKQREKCHALGAEKPL